MKIKDGMLLNVCNDDIKDGTLKIPKNVTSIGYYAFSWCSSLTSITIPDNVTSIGDYAFEGCFSLTSVTIGKGVTSIGDHAFYNCRSLTSVTIPDSVTSIGKGAFVGCSSLVSIIVDGNNTKYHSTGNCLIETESKTIIVGFENSVIPTDGSVTSIGDYAFYNCRSLTSVTIPDSVTSIGKEAFYYCSSLTSVTIGNGVTSIGEWAFSDCSSLASITIPDSVTSIGDHAFSGCSSLTSITIPDSVSSIGEGAFYGCGSLKKLGKFKATNGAMICKNFQYELGKWYEEPDAILCRKGFHFCENAFDLFGYYSGKIGKDVRFFEVEAEYASDEHSCDSKRVCKRIKLVREIKSYAELLN